MTAIHSLATFVDELSLDNMPKDVSHECKRQVLDAVTCAVASHRVPGGVIAARTGVALGGRGEATIIGMSDKVSAPAAAFANAQMLLALDLTSNLMNSQGLAGAIVFSAIALAETLNAPGSRVIEAIACGYEVASRVRRALPPRTSWAANETQLHWTIFGAAAASAKMLGLQPAAIVNCLALAGMSALPTNRRIFSSGSASMAKYALMGNVAALGIAAATLASEGFTGDSQYLDDDAGFWNSVGTTLHNRKALTDELGERWWMRDLYFKRLPAGTPNQPSLHTVALLIAENNISPEDIEEIEIMRGLGAEQIFRTSRPGNYIEAQFSLPFQVGALAAGVPPRDWSTALTNPLVAKIAENVRLSRNESIAAEMALAQDESDGTLSWWWYSDKSHVRLRAAGKDFAMWSKYERLTDEEVCEKFRHYAADLLPPPKIDQTIEMVFQLDRLERVASVTSLWADTIRATAI